MNLQYFNILQVFNSHVPQDPYRSKVIVFSLNICYIVEVPFPFYAPRFRHFYPILKFFLLGTYIYHHINLSIIMPLSIKVTCKVFKTVILIGYKDNTIIY